MKIKTIFTTYIIESSFVLTEEQRIFISLIMNGEVIISGLKKEDLISIKISTTRGDSIFTHNNIRIEVDSRFLSLKKVEKIFKTILNETKMMFNKQNIHLANKILEKHL